MRVAQADLDRAGENELSHVRSSEEILRAWLNRPPEEIEAGRAEVEAASRQARSLPPGKTLEDVVVGQVPGDETDEDLATMLKDL